MELCFLFGLRGLSTNFKFGTSFILCGVWPFRPTHASANSARGFVSPLPHDRVVVLHGVCYSCSGDKNKRACVNSLCAEA